MPNIPKPLTNTEVSQAKTKAKEYNLADGGGLALRVKPNGSKQWVFNYSKPYTKTRANISLGLYPEVSLADARKKRDENRKLLAQEIDPKEHKEEQNKQKQNAHGTTLEYVAQKWLAVKKIKITEGHAQDISRSLEFHIFPKLGKLPLHKLKPSLVIDTLEPIAASGKLELVKRISQRLNEIMVFALNTGLVDNNPLSGIGKAFEFPQKKHLPTIKPDQLPELMQRLNLARIQLTTRCLIEWQLHTMVRPSEAAGAEWAEIDFKKGLWNIPAKRMKKRKAHTVPLSPQTIALLEVMKPISSHRTYIFPSDRNPQKHVNPESANVALKRMGYGGQLVAHGLRALASTTLNEQGFDPDVIEAALSHVDKNEVRSAYNRTDYLERRKKLMCWWSDHIERAAIGNVSLAKSMKGLSVIK